MKREFSAGGIVFNNQGQVLVTQHSQNKHWSFPKGLIDPGQTPEQAAVREVREEGGVVAEITGKVGYSKYVYSLSKAKTSSSAYTFNDEKIFKVVTYFLMKYVSGNIKEHDFEVSDIGWFEPEDALKQLTFSQDKELLKKAQEIYGKW